jgi:hypothetical protein
VQRSVAGRVTTDQKVGGSSPSERAGQTLTAQGFSREADKAPDPRCSQSAAKLFGRRLHLDAPHYTVVSTWMMFLDRLLALTTRGHCGMTVDEYDKWLRRGPHPHHLSKARRQLRRLRRVMLRAQRRPHMDPLGEPRSSSVPDRDAPAPVAPLERMTSVMPLGPNALRTTRGAPAA